MWFQNPTFFYWVFFTIFNWKFTKSWSIWGYIWAPQKGDKATKNDFVTIMGDGGRQGSIFGAFLVDLGCFGEAFLRDFCCFLVWCGVAWRGAVWRGVAWRFYPSEASEASPVWLAFPSFVWLFLVSLVFPCFFPLRSLLIFRFLLLRFFACSGALSFAWHAACSNALPWFLLLFFACPRFLLFYLVVWCSVVFLVRWGERKRAPCILPFLVVSGILLVSLAFCGVLSFSLASPWFTSPQVPWHFLSNGVPRVPSVTCFPLLFLACPRFILFYLVRTKIALPVHLLRQV